MGEALLLSGNSESISYSMKFSPLLEEARKALSWRLDHDFHWNHSLRNSLWQYLATTFPQAYCPICKVTAVVEPAVKDLEKLWFVEVIVDTVCSADDCGSGLGTFHLVCEELMLSSPKNCDLKNNQYNLPELFLNRFSKHVNIVLDWKVRCTNKTFSGRARDTWIQYENLKVPSFLFLSFYVIRNSNYYFNDLKDSCTLDENIQIGSSRLNLLCSLMTSQLHFFSICNFFGKFYKLDNMIEEETSKGFDSFKEAYDGKASTTDANVFHLSKKSVRPRKGAVYFSIYEGEDRNEIVEAEWIKKVKSVHTLNDMQNIIMEEIEIKEVSCKDIPEPDEVMAMMLLMRIKVMKA